MQDYRCSEQQDGQDRVHRRELNLVAGSEANLETDVDFAIDLVIQGHIEFSQFSVRRNVIVTLICLS